MKNMKRLSRYMVLIAIVITAISLSGCVANPDPSNQGNQGGAGMQGSGLPFPVLTPETTTAAPSTNTIPPVVTPTPAFQGGQQLPWGGTAVPNAFVTPTSSAFTIVTQIPTATPSVTATVFALKIGSTGDEVRNLQRRLSDLGYYRGSADGDYGPATESAVREFQRRNNLTADGIAGRATTNKLYANDARRAAPTNSPTPRATPTPRNSEKLYHKLGDSGRDVTRMQERLIDLGYLSGEANGRFDSATEKAVYAFQERNVSYADGIAGPLTLQALYSSNARRTSSARGVIGVSLKRGTMDSAEVRNLQSRLKQLGYYAGAIDGDFGASTEAAVKAFQINNNLRADGIAGSGTLSALYSDTARSARTAARTPTPGTGPRDTPIPASTPITSWVNVTASPDGQYVTLREGHSGTLVSNLQQALKDQGYLSGTVDGRYGTGTVDAITRFQEDKGLSQDGIAGPATQRVLFEGNFPIGS